MPVMESRPQQAATVVRLARAGDSGEISRLRWEWSTEDGRQPAEPREAFTRRFTAELIERLADPRWRIWVAEDATRPGRLIGTVCLERVDKLARPYPRAAAWGYITNMYVSPGHRNEGIGQELIGAAIEAAAAEGLEMLLLWPSDRAVPFYERLGFAPVANALELPLHRPT